MKPLLILLFTTLFSWANGSFYDLYAQNRAKNRPNLITADFIASAYATYKLSREQEIEKSILKPRVINFANFLYQGIVEMPMPNKKQALAYTAMLSLLAKNGQSLELPDGYESLQSVLAQEAKLVISANSIAISPILKVKIDYRVFQIPQKYKENAFYFRTFKYAQVMPLNHNLKLHLRQTIQASQRLSNLEHHIRDILEQFVGLEKKRNTLISSYRGLEYYIFSKSKTPSIRSIADAIKTDPIIQKHILNLYSSYDYDFKIMQTLLKNNHNNAFRGYFIQSQYRTQLYKKAFKTKSPQQERRKRANIEVKLEETLSVMIEDALVFSNSLNNNKVDKNMILTLKELRKVAQKKSMNMALTTREIHFLSRLDLVFLELTGTSPVKCKRVVFGSKKMGNFSFRGRFQP